ncbi:MAG: glycosyltransferase family 2 protein [Pseudomonadota bacterium]
MVADVLVPLGAMVARSSINGAPDVNNSTKNDKMTVNNEEQTRPTVSVVIPMYNEEGAAASLLKEVADNLKDWAFEVVVVDDCSTDETVKSLLDCGIDNLRIIQHSRNAGQSRALRSGVLAARAPFVATLDGDGQNHPRDIPTLLKRLISENEDPLLAMVAGERVHRQDTASKKIASRIANKVRARLLNDGSADTGCGLKAFKREAYLRLPYFDHSHRYLPALMTREGYRIEYLPVSHRARVHGVSKYTNFSRLAVAFRDILGVMWLNARSKFPGEISEVSKIYAIDEGCANVDQRTGEHTAPRDMREDETAGNSPKSNARD